MMKKLPIPLLIIALSIFSCTDSDQDHTDDAHRIATAPFITFSIVNTIPHDTAAFTEGLSFYKGRLFESTGSPAIPSNNGTWIGEIDLATGAVSKKIDLGNSYFGEGMTFLQDRVYQLTYQSGKGFVYDAANFRKIREFSYKGEGWGLTHDGSSLIMSAGTSNLYYIHPDSLNFFKMLAVQDHNGYVSDLNELEYIDGYIYCNKWQTPHILKIDPATGYVAGVLDFTKLVNEIRTKYPYAEEMNGIAHDPESKKTFVTGKKWPFLYEIRF